MLYFYILPYILLAPYMLALIEVNFFAQCYNDNKDSILL